MDVRNLRVRAFKAPKDPISCQKYLDGHSAVLAHYGVENVGTANDRWFDDPNVSVVVAEDLDTGEFVGGMRIQEADDHQQLPVESAVGSEDPAIFEEVDNAKKEGGTGEFCGLWNSRSVKGLGISRLLTRCGTSILDQIDVSSMYVLCAQYTLPMVEEVGFGVQDQLGDEGSFCYPTPEYLATVARLDADSGKQAVPEIAQQVIELRKTPIQTQTLYSAQTQLNIEFDLMMNKSERIIHFMQTMQQRRMAHLHKLDRTSRAIKSRLSTL